jgi:hypothetical protein
MLRGLVHSVVSFSPARESVAVEFLRKLEESGVGLGDLFTAKTPVEPDAWVQDVLCNLKKTTDLDVERLRTDPQPCGKVFESPSASPVRTFNPFFFLASNIVTILCV